MVTDKQVEAAALALLNTGCVREPVAATESFMLARARSMARAALEAAEAAAWETIESAPKDGTAIVVHGHDKNGRHYTSVCAWSENWTGLWPVAYMAYAAGEPTLWRHLPQPSKETT